MKKLILLVIGLGVNFLVRAQNENALYFDNIDDNVQVANASALIANSRHITLSFWVYPENAAPTFPDYDGFCGFRDNTFADFYIVQIAPKKIEARFRNSAGTAFDINDTTLQLNTWQHYVFTYDSTSLSLYRNGQLIKSIAANGSIGSATTTFHIGNLLYSGNNFYLKGKMDELSLWNRSLSVSEIECIYQSYVDTASAGLLLYYKFNQGVASGNNTGLTSLINEKAGHNGVLNNFGLSGPLSNWVNGMKNYHPLNDTICAGQTYTFGTQTLTAPGIYHEKYISFSGCDSIVELTLLPAVNDSVSLTGNVFHAAQGGAGYQWINCMDSTAIIGENSQNFNATATGDYAVIITYNNCTDTSACYNYTVSGISNNSTRVVSVYPNPVSDQLHFSNLPDKSQIEISDVTGKKITTFNANGNYTMDVSSYSPGIYYINIKNYSGSSNYSILKK